MVTPNSIINFFKKIEYSILKKQKIYQYMDIKYRKKYSI